MSASDDLPSLGSEPSAGSPVLPEEPLPDVSRVDTLEAQPHTSQERPLPTAVMGEDNREPVRDTAQLGIRAIANLIIESSQGRRWNATGWFISPRVVVTAAHALFVRTAAGGPVPIRRVFVTPGRNGPQTPFGLFESSQFRAAQRWLSDADPEHDFAALQLSDPVGERVGWFGLGVFNDNQLRLNVFHVSGYPDDKPPGTLWRHSGRVTSATPTFLRYEMDTFTGQSGCPVFAVIQGQFWAAGIHVGTQVLNEAVRINPHVFQELMSWRA